MSEWKECKLSKVVDIISGGTPKTSISEYWNGSIPWLAVADFNNGKKFVSTSEKSITELGLENCSSKLLQKNDIIISARGTVGVIAMLEREMAFNQSCYGLRAKENSTNDYIYYFLKSAVKDFLQVANGGVFDTITRQTFDEIEISLPPLDEQKAIAEVLSSLDDKIDLLHRQNQTLENLAQTYFRHLFIDNAKDDWEEKALDEVAGFLNGLACQKYPPKNEIDKLPVLKIKELRSGFGEDCDWSTIDISKEYFVKSGDIIFSWSGSLLVKIWNGQNCILNQHLFKVTSDKYPKWFIYFWTKNHLEKFIEIAESKATTMGHIKRSDLSNSMVLVPTNEELLEMNKTFVPILEKIITNNEQIKNLEKLRDQLLPKLISGEITIKSKEENNIISTKSIKEKALESYQNKGHVDIIKITNDSGISVVEDKSINKGRICYKDNKFFIYVKDRSDRFSIAHELAHYAKDQKKIEKCAIGRKDEYSLSKSEEKETDALAAEFLMPEIAIREYIDKKLSDYKNTEIDKNLIKKCAKQFQVSDFAMSYRLSNLGYNVSKKFSKS